MSKAFTESIEIASDCFSRDVVMESGPTGAEEGGRSMADPRNELLSQCIVQLHLAVRAVNQKLLRSAKKFNYISPRDFLDFIRHFIELKGIKQAELVELQGHLNRGLEKLKETEDEVQ